MKQWQSAFKFVVYSFGKFLIMKVNIILYKARPYFIRVLFSVIVSSSVLQVMGQSYFPPNVGSWLEKSPAELKMNPPRLEAAVDFAKANEYSGDHDLRIAILKSFSREPFHQIVGPTRDRGEPAGMIIKNGYIVAKWGDLSRVDMTFSVTKSYLSTVVGLAYDDKLIQNLDGKVADYVWDDTFKGEHNGQITWAHLLTQSSDWYGSLFGMYDWADRPPREGGVDEWRNRTLNTPGTFFKYNDVRVNLLAYSALQVWRKSLPSVLKERIMDPIGASTTWRWYGYDKSFVNVDGEMIQSVSGGGHNGGGMFINTYDQARFGLLFLRNGNWAGKQLVSKKWIEMARTSSSANAAYGYMWWLNKGNAKWEGVSEKIYYASGFGGNFIVVDEEHDLLIVTRWLEPSKLSEMVQLVMKAIE